MTTGLPPLRSLVLARRAIAAMDACSRHHDTWHEGARLRWRRWGHGSDLVLLHGGHGSWMHWIRNIDALAGRFSLWVPDMPGFGDSDSLPGDPKAEDRQQRLVAALVSGLAQLPLQAPERICIAGFSFGGLVATQLACALGARAHRLALLGTAGHGSERRQPNELLNWRQVEGRARWQAHAQNLQALMLHDAAHIDAQALMLHACSSQATRYRSKSFSRGAPLPALLERYAGKLLLVWGEHDVTARPDAIGPILARGGVNRRLCIVPGAGHWVQYERSGDSDALLRSWLGAAS